MRTLSHIILAAFDVPNQFFQFDANFSNPVEALLMLIQAAISFGK